MVDLLTALAAGGAGVVLGGVVSYFVFYAGPRREKVETLVRQPSGELRKTTVAAPELERSRREMRTVMLERDLLSSALMKIYEAETEGRITKDEREMITRRYSDQIKELESKLKDAELVVEVGELEKLRDELVDMFEQKIQNLEARLEHARERLGVIAPQVIAPKELTPKQEGHAELERVVEKRAKPELSASERRVREIRDEVMDALTRLEQIDVEKKQQES